MTTMPYNLYACLTLQAKTTFDPSPVARSLRRKVIAALGDSQPLTLTDEEATYAADNLTDTLAAIAAPAETEPC